MSHYPCIIYKDFLPSDINAALLQHAVLNQEDFHASKIFYDKRKEVDEKVNNPKMENWRKSQFTDKKTFEFFYEVLSDKMLSMFDEICENLNISKFEVGDIEMQMTSHNDGDFYKPHVDNGSADASRRSLTFVYYFHSLPKQFSGGQLLFFQPKPSVIEPENNTIVFFDPALKHAVHPVQCPSRLFEHSRFTLNGWLRKKTSEQEPVSA